MIVPEIEPFFGNTFFFKPFNREFPDGTDRGRKTINSINRKSHSFCNIPDRSFLMLLCDRSNNGCPITAIFLVDILYHFFAALMLEVHIDIRWFIACRRDKSFEQQIEFGGVDRSNTQAITYGGVCGRSTPLAKNIMLSCETDDIIHGEKILRIIHLFHKVQLITNSG